MKENTKKRVLSKMVLCGMISQEEMDSNSVSNELIEMYVGGVVLLEDSRFNYKTVKNQLALRRAELLRLIESKAGSIMIGISKSYIKKLKKIETSLAEKKDSISPQSKMSFSGAKNQKEEIRLHLEREGNISSKEAFMEYGITRLSDIIYRLRNERNMIIDTIHTTTKNRYNNLVVFAKYVYYEK